MSGVRRGRKRRRLHRRICAMVCNHRGFYAVGRFMGMPGRALPNLLAFVKDPFIPPTNNAAERGLREMVVHRKIRGGIRSEGTMELMGNLFSCVSTWKSRGIDYLREIARYVWAVQIRLTLPSLLPCIRVWRNSRGRRGSAPPYLRRTRPRGSQGWPGAVSVQSVAGRDGTMSTIYGRGSPVKQALLKIRLVAALMPDSQRVRWRMRPGRYS